jgi:hypothetical protein
MVHAYIFLGAGGAGKSRAATKLLGRNDVFTESPSTNKDGTLDVKVSWNTK